MVEENIPDNPETPDSVLSGAPDKMGTLITTPATPESGQAGAEPPHDPEVIWDKNNKLVNPEMDSHFKRERQRVLGELDDEGENPEGVQSRGFPPPNTPAISHRRDEQTADPFGNPQPNADINNLPSTIGAPEVEAEMVAETDAIIDEARAEAESERIDRQAEREFVSAPQIGDTEPQDDSSGGVVDTAIPPLAVDDSSSGGVTRKRGRKG